MAAAKHISYLDIINQPQAYGHAAADGVTVADWPRYARLEGEEHALVDAGIVRPEWVAGLVKNCRAIALKQDGGFTVVREGVSGNYVSYSLRAQGLISIRRRPDGKLAVCVYRTTKVEKAITSELRTEREKEQVRIAAGASRTVHSLGLRDNPGEEEVERRRAAASACFVVGERVFYYDGLEAVVIQGYQMCGVSDNNGPYTDDYGVRFDYCRGYRVMLKPSNDIVFADAHQLTRYDGKPSYLRLVR